MNITSSVSISTLRNSNLISSSFRFLIGPRRYLSGIKSSFIIYNCVEWLMRPLRFTNIQKAYADCLLSFDFHIRLFTMYLTGDNTLTNISATRYEIAAVIMYLTKPISDPLITSHTLNEDARSNPMPICIM